MDGATLAWPISVRTRPPQCCAASKHCRQPLLAIRVGNCLICQLCLVRAHAARHHLTWLVSVAPPCPSLPMQAVHVGYPGELGGEPAGQFAAPSLRVLCSTQPACPPPTRTHSPLQTFLLWLCTFKLTVATSAVFLTLSLLFFFLAGGVSAKGCHQLNCATASIGSGACASNAKERQHRVLDFTSKASQPCRQAHNRLQACSADPSNSQLLSHLTALPCPPACPSLPNPSGGHQPVCPQLHQVCRSLGLPGGRHRLLRRCVCGCCSLPRPADVIFQTAAPLLQL